LVSTKLTPPEEAGLAVSAAGFACFCAGFLAGASFLPPSVLVVAVAAGLAAALAAPPPGIALISAFSAHSFTLVQEKISIL